MYVFGERSRSRVASPDMILPEPGTIAESKAGKTRLPVVSSIAGNGISEVLLAKNPHYTHNRGIFPPQHQPFS